MSNVCIAYANGCPRSRVDIVLLKKYFEANGWQEVGRFRQADMVVVSTCGFSERSENKSLRLLRLVERRRRRDARLVIVGCLPGINAEILRREFQAEIIIPTEVDYLDEVIGAAVKIRDIPDPNDLAADLSGIRGRFSLVDRFRSECNLSERFLWRLKSYLFPVANGIPQEPHESGVYSLRIRQGLPGRVHLLRHPLRPGDAGLQAAGGGARRV